LCANLIETIKEASTVDHFIAELNRTRNFQAILGKTELSRWAEILNRCDDILEDATKVEDNQMKVLIGFLQVDKSAVMKYNTISILRFTGLLFDCTSTRRIYASTDRIIRLTECTDMDLVGEVLRLLQTISKRSKFLTQRLCPEDQSSLVMSLTAMAQCWGGKLRNLKMDDCVRADIKLPSLFPFTFTDSKAKHSMVEQPLLKVVDEFAVGMTSEDRYSLLARIRMLRNFEKREHRMQCLIVRLLSISTLIYCRCQPDDVQINALLYSGFIEETVALLKVDLNSHELMDPIQTEALRLLCSVVSLEKASRTSQILDVLSAGSYHGFLAIFTRNIVDDMKRNMLNTPGKPSVALSTALLSFIYHLSKADPGGETLAACGLTQTLLSVIAHHDLPLDQATLATRCTRITDNFTTIDVTGFNNCKGMDICIDRLIVCLTLLELPLRYLMKSWYEVDECRKEQPFVIDTSGDVDDDTVGNVFVRAGLVGKTCHPQRSGLIKALITFIKRAIQDNQFQDSVRHIMEGHLPDALMHIISNSEYYSASLYHHATQLVVNFIYQEPSQLSVLQNRHVPYVILQSMLRKELPNSRDVISHMGNVFTALCLNEKGLKQFKAYAPFDHVFKIVLSIKFIVTMKKKRSEMNDAAQGIGSSLDDLLRHQPTLKPLMLNSVLGVCLIYFGCLYSDTLPQFCLRCWTDCDLFTGISINVCLRVTNVFSNSLSESTNVMSVAVDPPATAAREPAWALAGVTQNENEFWHRHKNVADMVIKANKTVSEFLSQLFRSCFVPTRRNRRYDFSSSTMSKSAQQMADEIFAGFFRDIKWESPTPPMEFVIVQMSVTLFDDRRQPFHAMLQRFYISGCHNAFCDLMIEKLAPALASDYNDWLELVFLEWFRLASKLANKQNMIHTVYRQPQPLTVEFDPKKYLKLVHNVKIYNSYMLKKSSVSIASYFSLILFMNIPEGVVTSFGDNSALLFFQTDLSISRACIELMPLCKRLMELGSDLVFSCADLVSGMVNTLDEEWRRHELIGQIMIEEIINMARDAMTGPSEHAVRVLATRIHFACLLFDHVADEYLEACASQPMVSTMLLLLGFVYDNFDVDYMQNGLLSPVVLWLDLHDKGMRALKRRNVLKAVSPQLKWSYHAEEERLSTGRGHKKWQPYPPVNQIQLNKAFFSGKNNCVIRIPRKEKDFTVDFSLMKQTDGLACNQAVFAELPDGAEIDIETLMKSVSIYFTVSGFYAHTILAFIARLTREPSCAANFIQQGGVAALLQLRCSTTPSTSVLTSLIIRQCIDDESMMTQVMEKSIRVVTNPVQSTPLSEYLGMSENKPKDWCETLNKLAPLSTRYTSVCLISFCCTQNFFVPPWYVAFFCQTIEFYSLSSRYSDYVLFQCLNFALFYVLQMSRGAILSLLAELVKSYPGVASLICEAKDDGQSVVHQLIEYFIDGSQEKDTLGSLKTLISILAACNHSPKAQESLVSDMKASLISVGNSSLSSTQFVQVSELCSLLVMMLDSCPSSSTSLSHSHHRHLLGGAPNSITKLFHKKRICNDLVRTITYLQLSQKEAIDTVNTVLKTLETLMRSTNSTNSSTSATPITHGARNVARAQVYVMHLIKVEDSMSSGEEDNEDRTVEDEGDDREEDDTMDGEDQDDEEEEDEEDGRREGEVQATVRVDAEESGEDGEEEEEDDDEEMYDYPEEDEDAFFLSFDSTEHTAITTDEPSAGIGTNLVAAENNAIPEEFRDILGDIEIPDGVDPAFLAALPEDMRAEVIRDHRRQQRAQRAAQLPDRSNVEGGSVTVPAIEPIDQDFLAALPPELQEEILAQHERAVREAEEALRRANAPVQPAAPEQEMDGAAVIASLPAHERTQVLAEMDESELQRLPTDMQDEARRARANLEPNILRFRHLLMPSSTRSRLRSNVNLTGFGGAFGGMRANGGHGSASGAPTVGSLAGQANTASSQSLQLLDRDSILILTMLFLVVFAVWVSLFTCKHLGQPFAYHVFNLQCLVAIHPLLSLPLSKNVLDSLASIAKTYPGHFLPPSLRKISQTHPPLDVFWELVQVRFSLTAKESRESAENTSLENSHVGRLMQHLSKALVSKTGAVQDRLLRVISTIVQTLPNETMMLLGNPDCCRPLENHLKAVVDVLMHGCCSNEGLADGRTLLVECMRALPSAIADTIYEQLFASVESVGLELKPQIERLIQELGEPDAQMVTDDLPSTSKVSSVEADVEITTTSASAVAEPRHRIGRLVLDAENGGRFTLSASSCPELQLPAVTMLTDKSGAQHKLLCALQTLSKIRDTMRQMKEERPAHSTPAPEEEDQPQKLVEEKSNEDVVLSHRLTRLDGLWEAVSTCLLRLGKASDHHAVLALQPAAEAFFLVHAVPRPAFSSSDHCHDDPDTLKMIAFAEKHREVLNQVLRQNNAALSAGGPFAALIQFPKLLDFDVKRKYFRKELGKMDGERGFRRADVQVQVRRSQIFSDSFRELYRLRPSEWKHRFYIIFQGEEGQDAGGLLREWFSVITREIFNPNYALFITAPGDMVTYMINKASYINPEHLDYFKFVGRLIAKAIYDNKLLDCYFTRAFYKHILNLPVRYQDLESEDPAFYKSLEFLLNNPIDDLGLDLNFSGGIWRSFYSRRSIRKQLDAFLTGFYEVIPKQLISMFNEQELELLISGLPDVDIDDLANNTEYKMYTKTSAQIQWFWRALRSFEPEDRAKFLQFVTGTSKVPLQGFSSLEGMNGIQKFSIHMDCRGGDRLPAAHTCFNQLDLPQYESYEKLRDSLLMAVRECSEGFGFA
uniref:HECT-type E3 ubiquitin transferase n=1 Tax=Angiostrongylus cantonensis TaxID=6313 RepID=A0A158P6V3_ANGCA